MLQKEMIWFKIWLLMKLNLNSIELQIFEDFTCSFLAWKGAPTTKSSKPSLSISTAQIEYPNFSPYWNPPISTSSKSVFVNVILIPPVGSEFVLTIEVAVLFSVVLEKYPNEMNHSKIWFPKFLNDSKFCQFQLVKMFHWNDYLKLYRQN